MDPTTVFCPNLACPARGRAGQRNIRIHARQDRRFLCTECHKTFTATKGTAFYRLRTSAETVTLVVTRSHHGGGSDRQGSARSRRASPRLQPSATDKNGARLHGVGHHWSSDSAALVWRCPRMFPWPRCPLAGHGGLWQHWACGCIVGRLWTRSCHHGHITSGRRPEGPAFLQTINRLTTVNLGWYLSNGWC